MYLKSESAAQALIRRSILGKAIYEVWGSGVSYDELHANVRSHSAHLWPQYLHSSFKFSFDSFQGSRSSKEQRRIMESFSYLGFEGPIRMSGADQEFVVFEEFELQRPEPRRLFFGRLIATGARDAVLAMSLKKRRYISTTSMDAELALLAANLTHAAPGKLFYDPFVGTGSLTLACAHFGALVLGSDIDGRAMRGTKERNLLLNFEQYQLTDRYLGCFISDLTHSPLRQGQEGWVHGIICDPPYGVREGLRVLGSRKSSTKEVLCVDGVPAHL